MIVEKWLKDRATKPMQGRARQQKRVSSNFVVSEQRGKMSTFFSFHYSFFIFVQKRIKLWNWKFGQKETETMYKCTAHEFCLLELEQKKGKWSGGIQNGSVLFQFCCVLRLLKSQDRTLSIIAIQELISRLVLFPLSLLWKLTSFPSL